MKPAQDILRDMGIDPDEAIRIDQEITNRPRNDKRICLCGHSVARHDMSLERPTCVVGKQFCPCRKVQPVLVVEDTRPFIRKTDGASVLHALTRGIAAASSKGHAMEKIEEAWVCHRCGTSGSEVRISPVPVSANGLAMQVATGYDAFLCDDCRIKS